MNRFLFVTTISEYLVATRLKEFNIFGRIISYRLQQFQSSHRVGLHETFGLIERKVHVGQRSEIVNLVGIHRFHDVGNGVRHVTFVNVKVFVISQMSYPVIVVVRARPEQSVNDVTLAQQQFGEITSVLSSHTRDQSGRHVFLFALFLTRREI
jgi:hypothetical protein